MERYYDEITFILYFIKNIIVTNSNDSNMSYLEKIQIFVTSVKMCIIPQERL